MDIICATCGCDLTVAKENWDNASVLRPLESVEVLPCSTCLSRAASEAVAVEAEYQSDCSENGGLGR